MTAEINIEITVRPSGGGIFDGARRELSHRIDDVLYVLAHDRGRPRSCYDVSAHAGSFAAQFSSNSRLSTIVGCLDPPRWTYGGDGDGLASDGLRTL